MLQRRTGATYREKRYVCGDYVDVYVYPVYPQMGRPSGRRNGKRRPTRAAQKKLNRRHAEQRLARLLHANFTERDLSVTLTWVDNPETKEQAMGEVQSFLRKLRYRYKRRGLDLKYVWQMERSGRGRYHVHMVLSGGMDRDELEQLWHHGYANTKRLQMDQGLTALARYMTKSHGEGEERLTYRSYNGSKNLIDPAPEISDSRVRSRKKAAELADEDWNAWHDLYPEYELLDVEPWHSDEYGSVYIFARLRRSEPGRVPADRSPKRTGGGEVHWTQKRS